MCQIGFIILRHVNNEVTNKYWNYCYDCIRKYYIDNYIIIIDDNSNQEYINNRELHNTTIIQSEYYGRGELLPYYYYLQNHLFDIAVIIHDSVFINQYIDFSCYKYKILWNFVHGWDQIEDETIMIKALNNVELLEFYNNKDLWTGCFGGMSVIRYEFLKELDKKYNISILLNYILNRHNRRSFERVIACLLQFNGENTVMFGNIHDYCRWGINFHEKHITQHLPVTKIWTGR